MNLTNKQIFFIAIIIAEAFFAVKVSLKNAQKIKSIFKRVCGYKNISGGVEGVCLKRNDELCQENLNCSFFCRHGFDPLRFESSFTEFLENSDPLCLSCETITDLYQKAAVVACDVNEEPFKTYLQCAINSKLEREMCPRSKNECESLFNQEHCDDDADLSCFDELLSQNFASAFKMTDESNLIGQTICDEKAETQFFQTDLMDGCKLNESDYAFGNFLSCLMDSGSACYEKYLEETMSPLNDPAALDDCNGLLERCLEHDACGRCFQTYNQHVFQVAYDEAVKMKIFPGESCEEMLRIYQKGFDRSCEVSEEGSMFSSLIKCLVNVTAERKACQVN